MGWFSAVRGEQWSLHLWSFDVHVSWAHSLARRMETLYYEDTETVSLGSKLCCGVLFYLRCGCLSSQSARMQLHRVPSLRLHYEHKTAAVSSDDSPKYM